MMVKQRMPFRQGITRGECVLEVFNNWGTFLRREKEPRSLLGPTEINKLE